MSMAPSDGQDDAPTTARPSLPDRNVTAATIEDAYVAFIFHCNPAVPFTSETGPLREALRNLPRSAGKSFAIFTLFRLVRDLELKVLRTWTELALKLGVDPPDARKGESSQKIQQYAVRLKRWMHAMHVDAFFEYLLGIPSPYWTDIPMLSTLVDRDGVSPADDMAVRALVPKIRPKRVRKRRDGDDELSPASSRLRTELEAAQSRPGTTTAHAMSSRLRGPDQARSQRHAYSPASAASSSDNERPRGDLWELRPVARPVSAKPLQRRHGAKVVSSAWRSRVPGTASTGKMRGRPPLNRGNEGDPDSPCDEPAAPPSVAAALGIYGASSSHDVAYSTMTMPSEPRAPELSHGQPVVSTTPYPQGASEDPVDSETVDSSAFPPLTTGQEYPHCTPRRPEDLFRQKDGSAGTEATDAETGTGHSYDLDAAAQDAAAAEGVAAAGPGFFDSFMDRTNLDAVIALQVATTMEADWFDEDGKQIPPCDVEEAVAICTSTLEHLYNAAPSQPGFLINLAALLGSRMLMTTTKMQMRRQPASHGRRHYACSWEYRLGHIKGTYQMTHSFENSRLNVRSGEQGPASSEDEKDSADVWKRRYENVLRAVQGKEEALASLRDSMYRTLRR